MPPRSSSRLALLPLLLLLVPLAAAGPSTAAEGTTSQPTVDGLVAQVWDALDRDAWEDTRYIAFDFVGARRHLWDRSTGLHRMEGETREGERYGVLHDIDDQGRKGSVWLDGELLTSGSDRAAELLERAYGAWINDTYWLLAAYKLEDPGVNLSVAEPETVDGVTYQRLQLTFDDGTGQTSGDTYWISIHPETGRTERWAYVLEGQKKAAAEKGEAAHAIEPTVWTWKAWGHYGPGILLSAERVQEGTDRTLTLGPIAVLEEVPESAFTSPEPWDGWPEAEGSER